MNEYAGVENCCPCPAVEARRLDSAGVTGD
jgi:hypothetical protein